MTTLRYQGTALLRVNGCEYPTLPGANLTLGGLTRAPVTGHRVYGWKGTPAPSIVTATIPNHEDISMAELNGMEEVTLIFEADIGKKWLIARAWNTGESSLVGEGDISTTFNGIEAQEL
ncbi:phage tail tube protein [Limnobaculum xujianqingii]|uniref:phage tail tube protein n=1 Tax=Limnobaculum xujianqingii TaxID=2738837 RepID=UPI001125FF5A|nr:phage tail tube protein [Limnobaculum xujianqingii]